MSVLIQYPSTGCVVEYLEGNSIQIAVIMESAGGKVRLLLPNRRETKLAENRILPWAGPILANNFSKDEATKALENYQRLREELVKTIPVQDLWEMTQAEMREASVLWFAELVGLDQDIHAIVACGRALLNYKTHFKFQPPNFQIFEAEVVEKRLNEQKEKEERERFLSTSITFLRQLWDINCKKVNLNPADIEPEADIAAKLKTVLLAKMADPEDTQYEQLWQMVAKALPEVPHLPFQLLVAWGILPVHYNFWLERASYLPGDTWWHEYQKIIDKFLQEYNAVDLPTLDLPFISIDGPTTVDIDDAFYVEELADGGWLVTLALACPALKWPFASNFDKAILRRGISLYLPEGDCHMLPEMLGTDLFSLKAKEWRTAFCVRLTLDQNGHSTKCEMFTAKVKLAANLNYYDCEAVLNSLNNQEITVDKLDLNNNPVNNPAIDFAEQLAKGYQLATLRQNLRIEAGAVIMDRPEAILKLHGEGENIEVELLVDMEHYKAQQLVAEMMILTSHAVAAWAIEKDLPLVFRTQDIALPKEYAGIWSDPVDITRIMRSLIPSTLEVTPKQHGALAVPCYAPITSPLRRYSDLVNEAQILHYLEYGKPLWEFEDLRSLIVSINIAVDASSQIQRFRPRYWKLLYCRQQNDNKWWDGIIVEETELYISVLLPKEGITLRAKRNLFGERTQPGQSIKVRLGKIMPLYNEISILETMED